MQPIDALSKRDQETIRHYIQLYAEVADPAPTPILLKAWNKNKRTLFKALGSQLRVKVPVEIPRNKLYFERELEKAYHPFSLWDRRDADWFLNKESEERKQHVRDPFVYEYLYYLARQNWSDNDLFFASRLIMHKNIERGYISESLKDRHGVRLQEYHFEAFKATLKPEMKTVRTIQKVLKAMHFPYMNLFDDWRNKINDLNLNQDIKADLVLSIHPLDFMTMSDNSCNWTSCMSWKDKGSYSTGTIEMMNSNMVILAYLEHKEPFNIVFNEEEYSIPNKSWRNIIYVHKNILLSGRAYPYDNKDLVIKSLDIARDLVKKNLNWSYQYINQPYRDDWNIHNNFYLKWNDIKTFNRPKNSNKPKHAIYIYTNTMYNDLIEYRTDGQFFCCRNYVPKTIKLCASGPATCMCCGESIEEPRQIDSYDMIGAEKICSDCLQHRKCTVCGEVKYSQIRYSHLGTTNMTICSDKCLEEIIYVPSKEIFYNKTLAFTHTYLVIGHKPDFTQDSYVKAFVACHHPYHRKNKDEVLNDTFFTENAEIIRVPFWVFNSPDFFYEQREGWHRRPVCGEDIKFFNSDEVINGKTVLEIVEKQKGWVPAKEVIDEVSSPVPSARVS